MHKPYYTFVGQDSLETLKEWRTRWVEKARREPTTTDFVLIGHGAKPADTATLREILKDTVASLAAGGLLKNPDPHSWGFHALRKAFRTECRHAKITSDFAEFWLGHDLGVKVVYDRADQLHEADFVAEYMKVEPYVSIDFNETTLREQFDEERKTWIMEIVSLREEVRHYVQPSQVPRDA